MTAEIMVTDRHAVIGMYAPAEVFLEGTSQIRTVKHFERTGVAQNVCLREVGKDRRVRVIRVEIVRAAARQVVIVVARIQVRGHDELADVVEAGGAARAFLRVAQSRQQQRGKDRDDRNDDEQLNQRESV